MNEPRLVQLIEVYADQRAKLSRDLIQGREEEANKARREIKKAREAIKKEYGLSIGI